MTGRAGLRAALAGVLLALGALGAPAQEPVAPGTASEAASDAAADRLALAAIGRLDFAGGGFCTAVLVAPDRVLTAAHCLFDRRTARRRDAVELTFRPGGGGAPRGIRAAATLQGYVPPLGGLSDSAMLHRDLALLLLDAPLAPQDARPIALHGPVGAGAAVQLASFGIGREESLSRERGCRFLGVGEGLLRTDCAATYGSSGAPVLLRQGGALRLLTIVVAVGQPAEAEAPEDATVAVGPPLPGVLAQLGAQLQAAPAPRPALPKVRRLGQGAGQAAAAPGETRGTNGTGARFVTAPPPRAGTGASD